MKAKAFRKAIKKAFQPPMETALAAIEKDVCSQPLRGRIAVALRLVFFRRLRGRQ